MSIAPDGTEFILVPLPVMDRAIRILDDLEEPCDHDVNICFCEVRMTLIDMREAQSMSTPLPHHTHCFAMGAGGRCMFCNAPWSNATHVCPVDEETQG